MPVWPAIDRPVSDWQVAGVSKGSVNHLLWTEGAWLFAFQSYNA
jgi:hypothetical protein